MKKAEERGWDFSPKGLEQEYEHAAELLGFSPSLLSCLICIIFNIILLQMLRHPATIVQIGTAGKS